MLNVRVRRGYGIYFELLYVHDFFLVRLVVLSQEKLENLPIFDLCISVFISG